VPVAQGGTISSYPYGSIDPIFPSLPRDAATVSPVEMYFSPLPPQLHDMLRELALRVLGGEISPETATNLFYSTIERDPCRWLTLPEEFVAPPELWVRAVGRKDGRAARCSCWFTAPMWNVNLYLLTSASLAAAVRKILRGEVREKGVMAAETAFEPQPFFDEVVTVLPEPPPDGRLIDESFEWLL